MSPGSGRMVVVGVMPSARSRASLAAEPECSSPRAAACSKALVSLLRWSYHHCASSASLANLGILSFSAICSDPLMGEVEIDQAFGFGPEGPEMETMGGAPRRQPRVG